MEYGVLGPLEVLGPDGAVAVGGPRPRALVALLLVAGGPVPIGEVVSELWGEEAPASAVGSLHSYVSRLRRLLPSGTLRTAHGAYSLCVGPGELDRDAFVADVAEGRAALQRGALGEAVARFDAALGRWRGPALPELADSARGVAEAERLEELRRAAEEDRAEAQLQLGRHAEVVAELEAAVAAEPLRERRWGQLMLALYRAGRQADALRRYQDLRARLADELGIDPAPELVRLERAILVQSPDLELAPPLRAATRPVRALPEPASRFVGRELELSAVTGALAGTRLLTLVGPGGVGKTRLAVEVAGRYAAETDALVAFAELAPLRDPAALSGAVAAAFGVDEGADLAGAIGAAIGGRPSLLVLDNCEHLVDAAATVADELVAALGELRVLATSREPLAVVGEEVWRLAPLREEEARHLLVDRAGPSADGCAEDALTDLCRRLDGLPLAIELAAARLRSMSVGDLAAALTDRFRVLTAGRGASDRHRSLRAVVEWSFDLLPTERRQLLAALSVFDGTFDAPAAAAVGAAIGEDDPLDVAVHLAELVERSLVQVDSSGRHRMLETIRQLAAEDLRRYDLVATVARAHVQWFHALARDAAEGLQGASQPAWLDRCALEHENLRAAMTRAIAAGEPEVALEIGASVYRYWVARSRLGEGRRLLESALAAGGAPSRLVAAGHQKAGALAEWMGDGAAARDHLGTAVAMAVEVGDRDVEALARCGISQVIQNERRLDEAIAAGEDALAVARLGVATPTLIACLVNVAGEYLEGGRQREATAMFEEALGLMRERGDDYAMAVTLHNLGVAQLQAGDHFEARASAGAALALQERLGNQHGRAIAADLLAQVCLFLDDVDTALVRTREAVQALRDVGPQVHLSIALGTQAEVLLHAGHDPTELLVEKLALDRVLGFAAGTASALELQARAVLARGGTEAAAELAERALHEARGAGNSMVLATTLTTAGRTQRLLGRFGAAELLLDEATQLWRQLGHRRSEAGAAEELAAARARSTALTDAVTSSSPGP